MKDLERLREEVHHLQKELNLYKMFADNSYGWEYWADNNFHIEYSSNSCERITGYKPEEFVENKNLITDIIHDDDKKLFINHQHTIDSEGNRKPIDFRIIKKNGEIVWLSHSCNQVYDENGQSAGIRGSNKVITKQKQTELALKESNEKYRLLSDLTFEGICIHRDGIIVEVNKSLSRIFGIKPDEIKGRNVFDFIHPEDKLMVQKHLTQKANEPYKARVINNNGKIFTVEIEGKEFIQEDATVRVATVIDVAEKRKTQANLRLLSEIVKQSPSTIVITDLEGKITYTNPAFTTVTGYTAEEARGNNPRILKTGLTDKKTYNELWETISKGGIWKGEFANKKKNGELYFEKAIISPFINTDGEIEGYFAIKEDITNEKRIEEALKEEEERYRVITSQITEGISVADESGRYVFVNPAFCKMLGYSKKELLQMKVYDLRAEKPTPSPFKATKVKGYTHQKGVLLKRKDNRIIIADVTGKKITYNNQNLILGVVKDITIQEKMLHALAESEENFHEIFRNMSDGCIVYQYDKAKNDFIIVNANNACEKIDKIKLLDIIGKYVTEVFPGVQTYGLLDGLLEVYRTGEPRHIPVTLYKDNRMSGWRENFVYKLKNNNVVSIYSDKTKEKEGELKLVDQNKKLVEALEQVERNEYMLREANATKDRFFNIIAHDLKSPFTAVIGLLEIILEEYNNSNDEERIEVLETIFETSKNTYNLLENLLEWSRSQSGYIQFNPEPRKLQPIIFEAISILKEAAETKQINLRSFAKEDISVRCDREMIHTVLRNIINNAIKFTPKGGSVVIDTSENEKNITVSVKDTGIGMSEDKISKLFDVTEKISTKGTEDEQGTGLGLVLCKEFIHRHGGEIKVESIAGKGSVFSFSIPK